MTATIIESDVDTGFVLDVDSEDAVPCEGVLPGRIPCPEEAKYKIANKCCGMSGNYCEECMFAAMEEMKDNPWTCRRCNAAWLGFDFIVTRL